MANGPTGQDNLSHQDLVEILRGLRTTWPNGKPIRIALRPESDSDSMLIKAISPEISAAIAEARKRPGMAVATHDLENAEMLNRTPGALGTISLSQFKAQKLELQRLAIAGDTRWNSNARSRPFVVIAKKNAGQNARGFSNFLLLTKAERILHNLNCPLSPE